MDTDTQPAMIRGRDGGELLTPRRVSQILDVAVGTLGQWRHRGVGPPSIRVEGLVRYPRSEFDKYLEERRASLRGCADLREAP